MYKMKLPLLIAFNKVDIAKDSKVIEWMNDYDSLSKVLKKNHDYNEAWRSMRTTSYTDFILTKIERIKEIENIQGATLVSEGIDANYMDIINYAVFGAIKLK